MAPRTLEAPVHRHKPVFRHILKLAI